MRLLPSPLSFLLIPLLAITVSLVPAADWSVQVEDHFEDASQGWEFFGGNWEFEDGGVLRGAETSGNNATAFPGFSRFRTEVRMETVVTIEERFVEGGWSLGGITLYADAANLWLLSLTDGPTGRYIDFIESYQGVWQAQNAGETQLEHRGSVDLQHEWSYGQAYRLSLQLTTESIEAEIAELDSGTVVAAAGYVFAEAPHVAMAVPGFLVRGCRASYDRISVQTIAEEDTSVNMADVETGERGTIAILRDHFPGVDIADVDALLNSLRQAGFGVTPLTGQELADGRILHPKRFQALVLPHARVFPAQALDTVTAFAQGRGHVFFLGGPAFTELVWWRDNAWLTLEGARRRQAEFDPGNLLFTFADDTATSDWHRASSNPGNAGGLSLKDLEGTEQERCLEYWTSEYSGWDTYDAPGELQVFGEGDDMLCLRVRGDESTPEFCVELREEDGSRWLATVPLTTDWKRIALPVDSFAYWQDSPTGGRRGGSADHVRPENVRHFNIGLASTHTRRVRPGEHRFWIDWVGSAPNPYPELGETVQGPPISFETISPTYKVYPLVGAEQVSTDSALGGVTSLPAGSDMIACVPRTMGRGIGLGQKWRWLPLAEATAADGRHLGSPLWLTLNRSFAFRGTIFGCLGYNDPGLWQVPAVTDAVTTALARVCRGLFLTEAGASAFSVWPGDTVDLGATVLNMGSSDAEVEVEIRVLRAGTDTEVARNRIRLAAEAGRQAQGTVAWTVPAEVADLPYRVVVELFQDGVAIDRIEHELGVLDTAPAPPESFIRVQGSHFYLNGEKWFPVGVNYWPLYVSGMDRDDYWAGWLDPRFYAPELLDEDLGRLTELGINLVSIQSGRPEFHPQLLDFLRRCRRHGIWVNVFLGSASPLDFDTEQAARHIELAHLAEDPTVFAYDTIWEPGNYVFGGDRNRWDNDWRAWIVEQYGGIESAEQDWGYQTRRDEDGLVISPADMHFSSDGPWRALMAAYRRFMDDLMSRKWNRATALLRELDPNHLISFRQGNTLPHDFVFTAVPKHVDFMCPEGYSIHHNDDGYHAAGFITRYIVYTTRAKPIIWSEFGQSVWDGRAMRPDPGAIESQADYHDMFYRMVLESGANGTIPWWWPGGYRVGERSDYGIVNPDGTPRPAAQLIREYGPALEADRDFPSPTTWFEFDRDAHAGGYWYAAFNTGMEAYREAVAAGEVLGVRSPGTGTDSTSTPLLAVGNRPCNGANPPKYLNAEFNHLQILDVDGVWTEAVDGAVIRVRAGQEVRARVSVGNTQEATWVAPESAGPKAGGVYLSSTPASQVSFSAAIPATVRYLEDADLGELALCTGPTAPAFAELRMLARGRVGFGEKRSFVLSPVE